MDKSIPFDNTTTCAGCNRVFEDGEQVMYTAGKVGLWHPKCLQTALSKRKTRRKRKVTAWDITADVRTFRPEVDAYIEIKVKKG